MDSDMYMNSLMCLLIGNYWDVRNWNNCVLNILILVE